MSQLGTADCRPSVAEDLEVGHRPLEDWGGIDHLSTPNNRESVQIPVPWKQCPFSS